MSKVIAAAFTLALLSPMLPCATVAQELPCQTQIQIFAENLGIIFDDMTNRSVVAQFWGEPDQGRQVSGYWFYGQPAACATGGIRVSLWANCEVSNAFTTGGCSIPGVPSQDL